MNNGTRSMLLLAGGGTALIWRYALANYLSLVLFQHPYPLPEAAAMLSLAFFASCWVEGRGWRIVQVVGVHLIILIIVVMRTIYLFDAPAHCGWIHYWRVDFFAGQRSTVQGLSVLLMAALVPLFWYGGWTLARKRQDPRSFFSRFDLGLTFFFLYFLVKFLAWHKGADLLQDPLADTLLISFLLFGLLSIALARHQGSARKAFISGYKTIGTVLGFGTLALVVGTGLVTLWLPYLKAVAQTGFHALQIASKPLSLIFIRLIRFLYAPRSLDGRSAAQLFGPDRVLAHPSAESSWWLELVRQIVGYGAMGLATGVMLIGLVVMIGLLVRWLMSKTSVTGRQKSGLGGSDLILWMQQLWRLLKRLPTAILYRRPIYEALIRWGRRSGIMHPASETPLEYGARLKAGFPMLSREIETIITLVNQEVYGGTAIHDQSMEEVKSCWRSVRAPRFWFSRLKSRWRQTG